MKNLLKSCEICPHRCKVNRQAGQLGRCRAGSNVKVALASIHNFEEPCISGTKGSGTVFFSNCNLKCSFCQNYKISCEGFGKEISIEKLAEIFLNQQKSGVHNLNLVSPTIYVPQIIEALTIAKPQGLTIPVVYNSSGYERKEIIELLKGFVDIYLPDFKYMEDELGEKYSNVSEYSKHAKTSILEMVNQVGEPEFEDGILQKGVVVRHLVLPNHIRNSMKVLDWLKENLDGKVIVSLMAQYFPTAKACNTDLNRKLTSREYRKIEEYLYSLSFTNGYLQELGKHEEEYVPDFNLSNIE